MIQLRCASPFQTGTSRTAFGLHFVKIKNQDAAVNSKITSFRFFLNDFPHLSV